MRRFAHLAYANGKAWNALRVLCVPNVEQKWRIDAAYTELSAVPRGGLPNWILDDLADLDAKMMAEPKRKYFSERLPSANVREMSWKKRQKLAEQIAHICVQIFTACGAEQGIAA